MNKSSSLFRCASKQIKMNSQVKSVATKPKSSRNKQTRMWKPHTINKSPSVQSRTVSFLYGADTNVNCDELAKPFGTIVNSYQDKQQSWIRKNVEMLNEEEANAIVNKYKNQPMPPGIFNVTFYQKQGKQNSKESKSVFPEYLSDKVVEDGLKSGKIKRGKIRVNPRLYHHAFVNELGEADILIDGKKDRNRAFCGDEVAYIVKDPSDWVQLGVNDFDKNNKEQTKTIKVENDVAKEGDKKIRKTAYVVKILKENHHRTVTGSFKSAQQMNGKFLIFSPHSSTIPRISILKHEVAKDIHKPNFSDILYIAQIVKWDSSNQNPLGTLCESIGEKGELETETRRILTDYGVDFSDFTDKVNECLPKNLPWSIPKNERLKRRDFTKECIFSIDPSTARDLDDALHCKQLDNGTYEVGVHIADVSYFINPRSELDDEASKRCTSVYMVQQVIPMLPRLLCEELCSLNPGVERLTFSVVWNISKEGKILSEWFGRSIINSCSKLSYDHAQSFIDDPRKNFLISVPQPEEYPEIFGGFSLTEIQSKVLQLFGISQNLRKKRFENGALKLDQVRLSYTLNENTGDPMGCYAYQYKQSNELIEEFMLLANIAVAHKIYKAFPDQAFLRSHPKPKEAMMDEAINHCKALGLDMDATSSGSLSNSIKTLSSGEDEYASFKKQVLFFLAIRPQKLATYLCSGTTDDQSAYHHYALNVPLYTHFTSPIRRYADVIVHRQLAAALGDTSTVHAMKCSTDDLQAQAELCNLKKSNSKACQDQSVELYFHAMVNSLGCVEGKGIVLYVHSQRIDILSIEFGVVARIPYINLSVLDFQLDDVSNSDKELQIKTVTLKWAKDDRDILNLQNLSIEDKEKFKSSENIVKQKLQAFSIVDLKFEKKDPVCAYSVKMSIKMPENDYGATENSLFNK